MTHYVPRQALSFTVFLAAACASPPLTTPTPMAPHLRTSSDELGLEIEVSAHAESGQVIVDMGPFDVPAGGSTQMQHHGEGMEMAMDMAMDHDGPNAHGAPSPLLPFEWPVEADIKGFNVSVLDGQGHALPREMLHHMIGVNFGRRQLAYPVPERFFGVGTETGDVALPGDLALPMARGQRLAFYAVWHNDTEVDLTDVYIRVAVAVAEDDQSNTPVLPAYFDTNNQIGASNMFSIEPGETTRGWEFEVPVSGSLLAATGHMHDYGSHVRLEDAETGEVLVRLNAITDDAGKIEGVQSKVFRKWLGLRSDAVRLEKGHRYRVVGVYQSPLSEPIVDGAMAHIVGLFQPDDLSAWPRLDPNSEIVKQDISGLPAPYVEAQHR